MSDVAAISGQTLGSTSQSGAAAASRTLVRREAAPYASPYLAGVGIGVVLLLSFVLMGRGLGASGAFSSVVTAAVGTVAPSHAAGNEFYARYLGDGAASPLKDWLVFEIIGVVIGGLASALFAGRVRWTTEHGPGITGSPPARERVRWRHRHGNRREARPRRVPADSA